MEHVAIPTIQAAATAGILEHTRDGGGDVGVVVRQAHLSLDDFTHPEKRLPLPSFVRLIESASRATGDAWFGAHLGEVCPLGALGLPGHIATLAPTVERALETFVRYYPLLGDATDVQFRRDGERCSFTYRLLDEQSWPRRQDAEQVLTMVVSMIRRWVDPRWAPELVWFEHRAPANAAEIERILGCPVQFDRATNTVWFDRHGAAAANPAADPTAFQLLSWFADGFAGHRRPAPTLVEQVRSAIDVCATAGDGTVEPVARSLGLQPRTLQRRLRAVQTSFRDLQEQVRETQAARLLETTDLPPKEIADRLGYANTSSFIRAFRRWTGATPARFRQGRSSTAGV
ncbi:MAG TPA: AraC family transcriptional regulator [Polyangia bacterium]|nr:AraC family transcriptional regulator [Polyangia bacterium]